MATVEAARLLTQLLLGWQASAGCAQAPRSPAMSKDAGAAAFRKTWDKEAFEAKAKARLDEELRLEEEREANIQAPQPIVQRAPLQRREADLQLTKFVNQRQMVTLGQAANGEMSGVYWCAVCQCHLRDSANYLLHINGKKHNRMLGMSMRAERATVGEVRERLASYKEEKQPELTKEEKAALFLDDFNQVRIRVRVRVRVGVGVRVRVGLGFNLPF